MNNSGYLDFSYHFLDDWGAGDTDDWGAGDTDKLSEEIQKMLLKRNEQDEAPKKVSKQYVKLCFFFFSFPLFLFLFISPASFILPIYLIFLAFFRPEQFFFLLSTAIFYFFFFCFLFFILIREKGVEQNKIETKQEQDIPKGIVSTSGLIVFIIRPEKKNKIGFILFKKNERKEEKEKEMKKKIEKETVFFCFLTLNTI